MIVTLSAGLCSLSIMHNHISAKVSMVDVRNRLGIHQDLDLIIARASTGAIGERTHLYNGLCRFISAVWDFFTIQTLSLRLTTKWTTQTFAPFLQVTNFAIEAKNLSET